MASITYKCTIKRKTSEGETIPSRHWNNGAHRRLALAFVNACFRISLGAERAPEPLSKEEILRVYLCLNVNLYVNSRKPPLGSNGLAAGPHVRWATFTV